MIYFAILLACLSCFIAVGDCLVEFPDVDVQDFDGQYEKAMQTYQKGDYATSIKMWKSIVVNNMMLQHATISCARKCRNSSISAQLNVDFGGDFPVLRMLGDKLAYGECFRTCMEGHPYRKISAQPLPSQGTMEELERRQPYNYLQFAYYKTEAYRKCAEAVTTYLQRNPDDEQMQGNMKFYLTLPQIKPHFFRDIEAPNFHKTYRSGVENYESGDYKEAISDLEETLVGFEDSHEECEVLCQHQPVEHGDFYKMYKTIAVEQVKTWECIAGCEDKISPIIQDWKVQNFTSRVFQFLQFAYFQVGETSKAVSCATSSFLMNPEADLARQNVNFYRKHLVEKGFTSDEIKQLLQPRKEALKHYNKIKKITDNIGRFKSIFADVYDHVGLVEEEEEEEDIEEKQADASMGKDDLMKEVIASMSDIL